MFYVGTDLKYFWFQKYYGKDNAVGNAETNYENGNINTINQWYTDGDVIYICSDGNFSTTDPVSYMAWDEDSQTVKDVEGGCIGYFQVDSTNYAAMDFDGVAIGSGAYAPGETEPSGVFTCIVVDGTVEFTNRITVAGTANVVLKDGAALTAGKGVEVNSGSTLNIYAQSNGENMDKLIANGPVAHAGIGSSDQNNSGGIYVHGGNITATSASTGAGIGGGRYGSGTVTIYGGDITATGGSADPGSGYNGHRVNGGGAGIGNGAYEVSGGTVTILGGNCVLLQEDLRQHMV